MKNEEGKIQMYNLVCLAQKPCRIQPTCVAAARLLTMCSSQMLMSAMMRRVTHPARTALCKLHGDYFHTYHEQWQPTCRNRFRIIQQRSQNLHHSQYSKKIFTLQGLFTAWKRPFSDGFPADQPEGGPPTGSVCIYDLGSSYHRNPRQWIQGFWFHQAAQSPHPI